MKKMPSEIAALPVYNNVKISWLRNKLTGELKPHPSAENQIVDHTNSIREFCINLALNMGSHVWAEFGVENGTSARYFLQRLPAKGQLHLFDSFMGNPEPWCGQPPGSRKAVKIPEFNNPGQVYIHEGWFKDTLPVPFVFDFSHVDCDLYSSTKTVLEHVNVKPGTIILFDEFFGYDGWEQGEYKALMEWDQPWKYIARDDRYRIAIEVLI